MKDEKELYMDIFPYAPLKSKPLFCFHVIPIPHEPVSKQDSITENVYESQGNSSGMRDEKNRFSNIPVDLTLFLYPSGSNQETKTHNNLNWGMLAQTLLREG